MPLGVCVVYSVMSDLSAIVPFFYLLFLVGMGRGIVVVQCSGIEVLTSELYLYYRMMITYAGTPSGVVR